MEGDGEGLVAIVQGLENSGVTLTVCNRPRHNPEGSRPAGLNRIQINAVNTRPDMPAADQRRNPVPSLAAPPSVSTAPAVQRTSVETSTGPDFSRMATASQICDGRYASSYKLAHCMISPTSPPEAVTEFPPQRKEPCRNQGNFEIGGHSSGQWNGHETGHNVSTHGCGPMRVPTSKVRHYGGTQTWGEKGSSHRYSKANHRESEAFAHSLRKYPSMAPFRTASTDLIEKLIRYTQAKHYQETSRSTKSMRSLQHQRSSDPHDANRVSTQQQTYTRRRDDNSHVQASSRGRSRNFKLYSPTSDNRHLRESRYREKTHSSSYDYLKAGSPPCGRANRSDGSPSPTRSRSPEGDRSSERSRSPHRVRSPDRSVSPCGSRIIRVERPSRTERPLGFERSVRDLSLSEMSKYIRSTIRQICNERPVVVQVCPKLKDRYNQHRKVCSNRNESSRNVMEFDEEKNPEDQASGSVLSRFVQSFSGRRVPSTEQTGCQCTRTDCYCNKATQCINNPTTTSNTATCKCLNTKTGCCRGMPCVCASKSQDQAYYNKRIDEEISEWLKNVPVHSIEQSESKLRRETILKELRKTLKQLPDDENFEENATNEIQSFVEEYPLWNPGKNESDEKLFKNQLADMLAEKIKAIPRKPDRLRDIVRKWVTNMDYEENGEEVDMEVIIDNFVNKLKSLAADRPVCDVKYTNLLKKEIIELFVELALKFDGDMPKLRKMANTLATEIASIPRNVDLSDETTKLENAFEENIADWICEHGLCEELKKDPKLIEGLTKRLNKLKAQGVLDEDIREEVKQFVDDVGVAFETIDEFIEDLMTHISSSKQMKETEKLDQEVLDEEQEVLDEELRDWLRSLPGASNLHLTKFEKIIKDLAKAIQENREQENENLANEIVNYLANTDLPIDPANLGEYVEELMENLGIVLSDKYHKEQAKRIMLKDIFEIIACSPIPEEKKEEMRSRAHEIVEKNLREQLFHLGFPPDSVKETLLQSMDDMVSDIDLPRKSRLQMKSLLNTAINRNFDESVTRLIRNRSDLKQSITNDVRNAIEELPIDQDKKNDLMQKVKETLSKNMNKPLPNNIKNNINEEICDAVERCPICEDRNVLGRIKKILSEIASKHLTIYLPNCVCDIQSEVEKDVSSIIDSSSIDFGKKRHLKGSIQEILSENEDRRLSEEVIRTIKKDIDSVVSDLSIPQDKKDILKKAVRETVSQDFNDAGQAFSHDLNKIRDKLFDDITNVIEKSPIQRDLKSHLMDKLDTVLARNLDSSISDEKAHMILDDISDIVRDIMPEEKKRSLTNKLAEKLGTHQREEETDELTKMINRLSIDSIVKDDMKKEIKAMLLKTLYYPLSVDVRKQILEDLLNEIDEIDIQEHEKKKLKSNITQALVKEFNKLSSQNKEVPEVKDAIEKIIKNEIKNVPISKHKQELLAKKLKDVLTENLDQAVTDEIKETIKERLEDIVDDHITDEDKADAIKIQLRKVDSKEFVKSAQTRPRLKIKESSWEKMQTKNLKERDKIVNKTQDYILSDMEQAIDEASIPREKKIELKNKLKNMVVKNFKKPLENVADGLKDDINVILDELNFTNGKKNILNRELTAAVDKNMNDLVKKYIDTEYSDTQRRLSACNKYKTFEKRRMPIEEFDGTKVKDKNFQEIDEIIEESGVPEEKQMELKRKLKKIAAENLTKPVSEDAQEATKNDISEIINELPIPKTEKTQLKSALTNIIYDNVDSFREKKVKDKPLHNIFKDTERAIEEAPIPREKKTELKKKLEKLTNKDFNEIPLENIPEELKDGMTEIIDELNLPRNKKNKLKSALNTATDDYISNMQTATRDKYTEFSDQQRRPGVDSRYKKIDTGLKPAEVVDAAKIKDTVLPGIEKIIEDSTVPKEKKMELKRKLNTVVAENLKKSLHEDVQDSTRKDIAEVIKDLPIPVSEKNKLKTALTSMVDDNMDNLRGATQKLSTQDKKFKKIKDKPLQDIFHNTEQAIEEAPIPREKKTELKKKLKKLTNKDFNEIPLENIPEELIDGTIEIINELNLPKDKKNKLKQAVTTATNEYMSNMQTAASSEYIESPDQPLQDFFLDTERAIEDAPIPREKKTQLKKKLKKLTNKDFNEIPLENIPEELIDGMIEIIDELNLPKDKKNKLKSALNTATDDYISSMQTATKDKYTEFSDQQRRPGVDSRYKKIDTSLKPAEVVDAAKIKDTVLPGIEKIIEDSTVPKEKKMELKRKLNTVVAENLKKPHHEDVQDSTKKDIAEVIKDLPIPVSEKNKLKTALTSMVDDNMDNLRGATQKLSTQDKKFKKIKDKPLQDIFQKTEQAIEEAPIPREKKTELIKKLKKLTNKDLNEILLENIPEEIIDGMIEIIDELNLPRDKKNKLISALNTATDEYISNMQTAARDKYTEYSDQKGSPSLDSRYKKNYISPKPIDVVDTAKVKDTILQGIDKITEDSNVPKEKKNELKRKLKTMANENLKQPFSEDVEDTVKNGITKIVDAVPMPKTERNKLKSALTNMVGDNMGNLRGGTQKVTTQDDKFIKVDDKPLQDIFQQTERAIEEASLPREKKNELKKKMKNLTNKDFNKIPFEDVAKSPKSDMIKIIDEMNLPKDKKNNLKSAVTTATDEYMNNMRTAARNKFTDLKPVEVIDAAKVKDTILQGIDTITEDSNIPKEKKMELKRKLKTMVNENLKKRFSEDVVDTIKDGIAKIVDDAPMPKTERNKLKSALINMVGDNMGNLRGGTQKVTTQDDKFIKVDDKPLQDIFQQTERAIEEAPLPRTKKNELKKKLGNLTNKDFHKIPLEDVVKPPTDDMIEIIDEMNLPKDKKNNLKSAVTTATDEYMSNMRTAARNKYNEYPDQPLREIFKEIERAIEEAPLSREKKNELKKKLKKLSNTDFNKIPLDDVAKPPTDDILEIIDELNIPKDKKINLKSALTTATDEYMSNVRTAAKNKYNEYPDQPLHDIFKEMERTIEESTLSGEKKNELKKKLKKLTNKDYNKIPLEDFAEGDMNEIIDEMNLPKDKKHKLKSALTTAVDEYKSNMQTDKRRRPGVDTKYKKIDPSLKPIEIVDGAKVKNTILQEIEKIIENSTVPKEKRIELKRKLKNITDENLKKPFSKDVQDTIKNGIAEIIDELPISKTAKNHLNNALTNMLDENIPQEIDDIPLHNIYKYMKRAIGEAPISKEKKVALEKKLLDQATKDFNNKSLKDVTEELKIDLIDIIDELNLPKDKKNNLKNVVLDMIDKNTNILQSQLYESPSQFDHSKEPEDRSQRNILQGFDEVIDEASIPWEINTELKKKLKDIATKNFKKPWSDDVAEDLKDDINKILDETNLPNDKKNNLKNELTAVVNENTSYPKYESKPSKASHYQKKEAKSSAPRFVIDEKNVKGSMKEEVKKSIQRSEIGDADKSNLNFQLLKMISGMLAEFDEALDERMKQIFDKYGITPSYWKTLHEEYNKLSDIILKGGDLEAARRKLIEKLMRDLNLSEEVATALVDELIALAREIAQKEGLDDILEAGENVIQEPTEDGGLYSIDPSYIKILEKRSSDIKTLEKKKKPVKAFDKIQQPKQSPMEYKEQNTSQRPRRDQAPSDIKGSAALSTGNINYSLKELIATNKNVRKQWSKHLDDAIIKLPLLRKENNDLKNKLAIYDETGQINILSDLSRSKEETNSIERDFKSIIQVGPKPALKNNKGKIPPRLSKIEEAFAFNNTTRQKSPFTPNAKQDADMKDFTSTLKETINTWLKKAQVEIEPNEKNRILEELAKDIIYRQKYIQTFGAKPSETENLEYMKLQVYRRLNGMVPIETLKQAIENTKELVAQIDNVRTPPLVVSPAPTKTKIDQRPSPSTKAKDDQRPPSPTKTKDDQRAPPTIPQIAQQKRNSIVFKKPPSPTQRKLGPADILGIHAKATNTTTADGVLHTVDDDDGVEDESDTEFSPGQASTPAKPINYIDKATDCVTSWIESLPIDMEPEMRMEVMNDIVSDIVDRQKYLQAHPEKKFSDKDEIENLRFQVFKRLDKILEPGSSATPSLVKIEELYRMINGDGQRKSLTAKQAQEFQTALNLEISGILNDYHICCDKRELLPSLANELIKLRNSGTDQDEIVENLIDTINRLTYLRGDPAEELAYKLLYRTKKLIAAIRGDVSVKRRDFKDAVMNDVGDVFQGSPMSEAKRRMMENQLAEGYAKDLGIPLEDSYATMSSPDSESKKERYGMSFNGLSNFIDSWLSSIPEDDSKDEDEIMDMKKQRMYCLMHKIGEMNVDPEIFNDDSLYEAVLRDELQHLFGDVSMNDEEFKALKEDLIEKVLESQRRAHDELAGQNYKNNLRDTMSKLLPDQRNLSKEDQATMETLKDQLADAYIDLHYSGNNESQRDKLKRKISNEINTFCRDYLNRNPCSPLNSQKLNHDLYAALSKFPLPAGDSIKYEVEQARIREEINDWVNELPLQPQNPTELLARNKLIYVLSKKLFDIELDEQEEDTDELMRKKIVTFLNKLPLESDDDNETIADTLIDKLKASEKSRKYNASANVTIDAFGMVSVANSDSDMKAPICPGYKPLFEQRKPCGFPKVCRRPFHRPSEVFPPCTLNSEERDHLDRIRRRNCLSPNCVTSLMRNKCPLRIGPPPIDARSQTEEPQQSRICPFAYEKTNRPCPRVSANLPHQPCPQGKTETCEIEKSYPGSLCRAAFEKTPRTCPGPSKPTHQSCQMRRHTISSSNVSDCTEEVQPKILIKQYYWDPLNNNSVDLSDVPQSGRSSRRQSDSLPSPSPRPAPCASPRLATFRPATCSPPRPASCTSSRPPPCRPPPSFSSRPPPSHQSLPCETQSSCPQPTPGPCRRPSSGKLKQHNTSPQPKSPRQNSSERYSYYDPLNTFQRSSHRDILSFRPPCAPSPCMSPLGISQCSPPGSAGFSKRFNECRMPKKDGLQDQVPSNSSRPSQKERVIELGSLDDVRSTRPKKRHSDQSDWPKFHEDDNFWAAPMRRVILDEGIDESLVMERERREERVSCRCKERLVPKCGRSQPATVLNQPYSQSSEEGQNLKRCSKCCGIHCPYPSFLYFRQ